MPTYKLEYLLNDEVTLAIALDRVREKFPDQSSDSDDEAYNSPEACATLVTLNNEKRIIKSEMNPVVEKYLSREFTGLIPTITEKLETTIHPGLFGVSTGYTSHSSDNTAAHMIKKDN